jgi:hypothetical protein
MKIPVNLSTLFDFPKQERVSSLVQEAVKRIPYLDDNYNANLTQEFSKVQSLLDTEPSASSQKALLLGLARHHIARAEKYTVRQIVDNGSINVDEMSHLVRVRLICAELSNLFAQSLADFKAQTNQRYH